MFCRLKQIPLENNIKKFIFNEEKDLSFLKDLSFSSINLEICCGTGEFLVNLAKNLPNNFFLGIDYATPCIQRAAKKAFEYQLNNILFYNGSIKEFFNQFSTLLFSTIMINFPDPWPKKKHLKRRIVNERFINVCIQYLKKQGELITVTDSQALYSYHFFIINACNSLQNLSLPTPTLPLKYYNFSSKYQRKNMAKSQQIFYTHHFKK